MLEWQTKSRRLHFIQAPSVLDRAHLPMPLGMGKRRR